MGELGEDPNPVIPAHPLQPQVTFIKTQAPGLPRPQILAALARSHHISRREALATVQTDPRQTLPEVFVVRALVGVVCAGPLSLSLSLSFHVIFLCLLLAPFAYISSVQPLSRVRKNISQFVERQEGNTSQRLEAFETQNETRNDTNKMPKLA